MTPLDSMLAALVVPLGGDKNNTPSGSVLKGEFPLLLRRNARDLRGGLELLWFNPDQTVNASVGHFDKLPNEVGLASASYITDLPPAL